MKYSHQPDSYKDDKQRYAYDQHAQGSAFLTWLGHRDSQQGDVHPEQIPTRVRVWLWLWRRQRVGIGHCGTITRQQATIAYACAESPLNLLHPS
jgi:hypothetical protein